MDDVATYDPEVEMCALGSMMLSSEMAAQLAPTLAVEAFYSPAHGLIFRAVSELVGAGSAVDLVTVKNALLRADMLENVGGVQYLMKIAEAVPSPTNGPYYADILRDAWGKRRIEQECRAVVKAARNGRSYAETLSMLEGSLQNLPRTAGRELRSVEDAPDWEPRYLVEPYFLRGHMFDISAMEASGKTTLLLAIANAGGDCYYPGATSLEPFKTLIFTGEQDDLEAKWKMKQLGLPYRGCSFVQGWMLDARGMQELQATLIGGGFGLFCCDPITDYLPIRSEIDNVDIRRHLMALREVLRAADCAGINVRHNKKYLAKGEEMEYNKWGAGGKSWLAACRGGSVLLKHPKSTKNWTKVAIIASRGSMFSAEHEPYGFVVENGRFSWLQSVDLEEFGLVEQTKGREHAEKKPGPAPAKTQAAADAILELMGEAGEVMMSRAFEVIVGQLKISRSVFYDGLKLCRATIESRAGVKTIVAFDPYAEEAPYWAGMD